jgi:hypothetical protein
MRQIKFALVGILALLAIAPAAAQPANLAYHTVWGRIGAAPGDTGPGQQIPFATLQAQLASTQSANKVYAGPTSGGVALPTFRSLVGADLPVPGASSLGGVQSLTCATSNWFSALSTGGIFACSQPNFTDLAGSIAGGQIPTGTITSAMIFDGTIVNADVNANAAIALSKLATQANNTFVGNVSGGAAVPVALTPGQVGGALCVPSRTVLITGTSLTYTTPTCNGVTATWLEVDVQGGGGGGGGSGTGSTSGAGTTGNASLFGALSAGGGSPGAANSALNGGAGGTCSGSLGTQQNFPGSAGTGAANATATGQPGAPGGVSFYGGAGINVTNATAGGAAPPNSGGGGSGGGGSTTAGVFNGNGGGAGCHISTVITSPAATYTYTVGALAAGGTAGTSGFLGGGGAAGLITAVAHWQ